MKRFLIALTMLAVFTPHFALAEDPAVLATVNGQAITNEQVMSKAKVRMAKVLSEVYNVKKDTLDDIINDQLIATEAKKQGLTSDQLMKKITKDIAAPTDAEAKAIYDMQKDRFAGKPFDAVKDNIKNQMNSQKQKNAYEDFIEKLRSTAKIEVNLERPSFVVSVDDDPSQGPKNAPITLIEFSEFQCPFCKRARPTVNKILETYKGQVQYVFRDFPLSFHANARSAAHAANCANDQGKYWDFSHKLFENQQSLGDALYKKTATDLKLNLDTYNKCMADKKYDKEIDKDQADGMAVGVTGTPAYFINGKFLSGAQPFENFKVIIDEELAKAKKK